MEYWMDNYKKADRLVVAYEKLVDEEYGAEEALRMAEFLDRSEGVMSFPPEDVPCAWHKIVKAKKNAYHVARRLQEVDLVDTIKETEMGVVNAAIATEPVGASATMANAVVVEGAIKVQPETVPEQVKMDKPIEGKPAATAALETQAQKVDALPKIPNTRKVVVVEEKYDPPYNKQQLKDMIQIMTQLLERYRDDKELAPVLVAYIDEVAQRSKSAPDDININF